MANHITNSAIQTLLAVNPVGSLTLGQFGELADALDRINSGTFPTDAEVGSAVDPTLATVFPAAGNNP
jgi:hypothetical protein